MYVSSDLCMWRNMFLSRHVCIDGKKAGWMEGWMDVYIHSQGRLIPEEDTLGQKTSKLQLQLAPLANRTRSAASLISLCIALRCSCSFRV